MLLRSETKRDAELILFGISMELGFLGIIAVIFVHIQRIAAEMTMMDFVNQRAEIVADGEGNA